MPGRPSETALGLLTASTAFLIWGLSPVFWKALGHLPAEQLLAYRIAAAGALMTGILVGRRRLPLLAGILRRPRTVVALLASTALIATNWYLYIWAIANQQVLQASLGYFVNPLLSVLLGALFLRERLRRAQLCSLGLAAIGVAIQVREVGEAPWLALTLAASFALYTLVRKTVAAGPVEGLTVETWLLAPLVFAYLVALHGDGADAFGRIDRSTDLLLVATGVITAVPLLLFTHGARCLPLSTVGLLQYLAPTLQFLLAVVVYGEPFGDSRLVSFGFIWVALALFSWDLRRRLRDAVRAGLEV